MSEAPQGIAARLKRALEGREGLLAGYLFGSRATDAATSASDADVAVLFTKPVPLDRLIRLGLRLEDAVGISVDLLDLRRVSPFLALDIVRGIRFVCHDAVAADEYELYVLRQAGDLEFLERERRAALLGMDR
jgi:predicted nucleotidyltransferase